MAEWIEILEKIPHKTLYWDSKTGFYDEVSYHNHSYTVCSNCRSEALPDEEWGEPMLTPHCPFCGAKMEGANYDKRTVH